MTIHGEALLASHTQSRVVVTLTVPLAPVAGADSSELLIDTAHLGVEGALTDRSLELQPASTATTSGNDARPAQRADDRSKEEPFMCDEPLRATTLPSVVPNRIAAAARSVP